MFKIPSNPNTTLIVGVDCATVAKKRGVALGYLDSNRVILSSCSLDSDPSILFELLDVPHPVILCLDAPLGWPTAFKKTLSSHLAGGGLAVDPTSFFKRRTDSRIAEEFGKRPLEVTANFIARTAYSALSLLEELAKRGRVFCLASHGERLSGKSSKVIEVYPAGTLHALFAGNLKKIEGYKKKEAVDIRKEILCSLDSEMKLELPSNELALALENDDVFDACLCVLAGADFLLGRCEAPTTQDELSAREEGWIWVRKCCA